ncbi:MAG: hypothetical protein RhofKO_10860 [Rhodothermales bacterium]
MMRFATLILTLLIATSGLAQAQAFKATNAQRMQQEAVEKFADDPAALQKALTEQENPIQAIARDVQRSLNAQQNDFVARQEAEPNNFFNTADDLSDVLGTPGWRTNTNGQAEFNGALVEASLTAGDVDVYQFTAEPGRMYYFFSTHSFLDSGEDGLSMSLRLFHESDLDTTFVEGAQGIEGIDKMRGDIIGSDTDGRNGSGDVRLTGWVPPVDPATGEALTGTFYLWVFNEAGETGTYFMSAYSIPMEPWVSRFESNENNVEVFGNGAISRLPTDAVVRTFMMFNPDTLKFQEVPPELQSNSVYPRLQGRGDEDVDHYLFDYKAGHTVVVETLPYLGWYRTPEGEVGPAGSRVDDPRIRIYDADYTTNLFEDDDGGRETMDGPNNIHSRIVVTPQSLENAGVNPNVDTPLWLWVSAWSSTTRDPGRDPANNDDPGRFIYDVYLTQYANDPVEQNFEPNDTPETAYQMASRADAPINGQFTGAGDMDVFRMFLHEVRMYSMVTTNATASGAVQAELYHEREAPDGSIVRSGNLLAGQNAIGPDGQLSISGFVPERSGAYVLALTGPGAGTYDLAVFDGQVYPNRIANEPDDTAADAVQRDKIAVGVGSPRQNGAIFPAGDVDHYLFDGVAGQQVAFKLQSQASALTNADFNGSFALLDSDLNVLATGSPAADAYESLAFSLPSNGTYIIQVKAADGTDGTLANNNVGLYSLNVGEPVREVEPNNTPANATVLLNGFVAGTMTAGDVDYYRISAEAGRIYHLRSANQDAEITVDLFRADAPSTSIHDGSDWNGRYSNGNFKVQVLPTESTDYLVQLTGVTAGSYEIHIKSNAIGELTDGFEPNNDIASAPTVAPNGVVQRAMLYNAATDGFVDDIDYYRINIDQPGGVLTCESLPFDGAFWGRDFDGFMLLFDEAGNELASNDDNSVTLEDGSSFDDWHSRIAYTVETAGAYFCAIRSQDFEGGTDRDPTTGEYKFRVSYRFEEAEPNNAIGTATALAPLGAMQATLAEGDTDVYALNLEPGFIYHVRTFRGEGMDSFSETAQLLDASGASVTDTETGSWRTRNNGSNIKLNLIVQQPTTYYLQIGAPGALGEGTYEVLFKRNALAPIQDAGEPNNTIATAHTPPADGTIVDYMLYDPNGPDFHDDADYYRVDAAVGDTLIGETYPFNGALWPRDFDAYMYLYGPGGAEVATNDDGGFDWHSKITHVAQEAGTYTFLVIGQDAAIAPREQNENRFRDPARGEYKFSLTRSGMDPVSVEDEVPLTYDLAQNYPNPFNPSTTIQYQLPQVGQVHLAVYNVLGQLVQTLVDGVQPVGQYRVQFDARSLASGMYIYRIQAGDFVKTQTMLLVK